MKLGSFKVFDNFMSCFELLGKGSAHYHRDAMFFTQTAPCLRGRWQPVIRIMSEHPFPKHTPLVDSVEESNNDKH